jgi:hypothetical protein
MKNAEDTQEELKKVVEETIEAINSRSGKKDDEKPCYNGDVGFKHILKSFESAKRKLDSDYGGTDVEKLVDICRATIVCTNASQMKKAREILGPKIEGSKIKIGRIKDSWSGQSEGYGDIKFNLPVGTNYRSLNMLCEIQVMTEAMKEAKHNWGHALYEIVRIAKKIPPPPDIQGRAVSSWEVASDDGIKKAAETLLEAKNWSQIVSLGLGSDADSVKTKLESLKAGNTVTFEGREMTGLNMASNLGYGSARADIK